MFKSMLFTCGLFCLILPAQAENWPHWRGDQGNGVSLTAKPPVEWSADKNVKWKVPIPGRGSGSPIIWKNQVFIVTAVPVGNADAAFAPSAESERVFVQAPQDRPRRGEGRRGRGGRGRGGRGRETVETEFKLISLDRETGDIQWQKTAAKLKPHEGSHSTNGFASASPCTDGKHVYAHFGSRGLYCYTLSGDLVWKRDDLGKMSTRASFGEGSSPTIEGDKIIVPWDHEGQSHLFALNKLTGKTIWKIDRDEPTCWATPLVVQHGGKKQIIMNGQNSARAYDLESGKELWRCSGQTGRPVASAVAEGGLVFIGSGYRGSFLGAFHLDGKGDIEDTKSVAWTVSRNTPDVASPVLSEGRLYYYKARNGILTCVNAQTGEPHYSAKRVSGLADIYASPIAAGGHVYLTDRDGTTVVIKDGEQFEIVSENSVGETVDASPAPVDNQLFIRGEKHLFCIAEK